MKLAQSLSVRYQEWNSFPLSRYWVGGELWKAISNLLCIEIRQVKEPEKRRGDNKREGFENWGGSKETR